MTAIAELKALYMAENRRRFPSLPEGARACYTYTDKNANGLTRCILDFLRFKGHQSERISVTGRFIDQSQIVTDVCGFQRRIGSGKYIKTAMQPGTADISAIIHGKSVKIEVKIGRDRQSPAQRHYQEQVERAKGIYFIATSFGQFLEWFNELTKTNPGCRKLNPDEIPKCHE